MIPYVIALVGSYLIGESMQSKIFAEGGDVSGKEYQIKKPNGTFFYVKMQTGAPAWSTSADMAYQYTKDEAEKIKSMLENQGATGLSVVKYDKDWWKNTPYEFADGGILKDVADIEIEIEKMNSNTLELEVEFDKYDGSEDKYYFEYSLDKDSYSLSAIYDDKRNMVSNEKQQELESDKYLNNKLENAIMNALSTYADEKYESNRDYEDNYAKGGVIGDAARVKSKNKTGVIMKILKPDDVEQFSDIKREKHYVLRFVDGTQDTYSQSEIEIYKN